MLIYDKEISEKKLASLFLALVDAGITITSKKHFEIIAYKATSILTQEADDFVITPENLIILSDLATKINEAPNPPVNQEWAFLETVGKYGTIRIDMEDAVDISDYTIDNPYPLSCAATRAEGQSTTSSVTVYIYFVQDDSSKNLSLSVNTYAQDFYIYTKSNGSGIGFMAKCYDINGSFVKQVVKENSNNSPIRVTSIQFASLSHNTYKLLNADLTLPEKIFNEYNASKYNLDDVYSASGFNGDISELNVNAFLDPTLNDKSLLTTQINISIPLCRNTLADISISNQLERQLQVNRTYNLTLIRSTGFSSNKSVELKRVTQVTISKKYDTTRASVASIRNHFLTRRIVDMFFYKNAFLKRKTKADNIKDYPLQRVLKQSFEISKTVSLARDIKCNITKVTNLKRATLIKLTKSYHTQRIVTDSNIFIFELCRKLQAEYSNDSQLNRKTQSDFTYTVQLERLAGSVIKKNFNLNRKVFCRAYKSTILARKTYFLRDFETSFPLHRKIVNVESFKYELKRKILSTISIDTDIMRKVVFKFMEENNLERQIGQGEVFVVSKENLERYTEILKQQLDSFIDKKIDVALRNHNLI